jgi:pimeloyl-ACP methyl ester carboxylesterase
MPTTITKANGIELAWDSFGNAADPAMLLISGLGTQMIRWTTPFCEALAARGYRVIRFDNRDSGCSTHFGAAAPPDFAALASALMAGRRPDVPYTLGDMAADAVGLLDVLGIAQAHVVGRSMGGMIAQVLASDHADRILSLTSIMSSTGNPALPQAAPDVMAMMMRPAPDPITDPKGFLSVRLASARRIAGTRYPFHEEAHSALLLQEAERCYDPAGTARQIAAMAVAGDRRALLSTITTPTLVIHGADDPLFLPACGLDTAHTIPNASYLPIEGMGHDLPPELNGTVIEAICRVATKGPRCSGAQGGGVHRAIRDG